MVRARMRSTPPAVARNRIPAGSPASHARFAGPINITICDRKVAFGPSARGRLDFAPRRQLMARISTDPRSSVRNPRDFFQPQAIGAPEPLREIPVKPSRMIHFLDFSNEKMVEKAAGIAEKTDILLGNLEDAIPVDRKEAARQGLIKAAKESDFGQTALWTRVNSLESPWVLDDLTTLVTEIGDKLEVVMVPKVEGAWDIHYVDRLLAQLEAKAEARPADPDPRDPRDRPGRGQPRGDRRRQPAHAGDELRPRRPRRLAADEDHPRRRRPPRLPGDGGPRRPREPRGRPGQRPAGPLALLDRPHGRRLRRDRHPALLRPLRRHQGHGRLRDPVPRRLPDGLRRRLVAAPGADRHRQEGLQPAAGGGQVRQEGAGGDPRRRAAST